MQINDFKTMEPMKYWSLPTSASAGQKKKMKTALASNDYYAVLKRDGAWYRFIKSDTELLLQSRTLSKKTGEYVEKQNNVPHIIEELNNILPTNTVVIGEIVLPLENTISSDVITVMGCLPEKAIARQKDIKLHYYIFDILMYKGLDVSMMPAETRIKLVQKIKVGLTQPAEYIEFAEPVFENVEEQIGIWLEQGEEGGVLMHKNRPYVAGRSPAWYTIKFKQSLVDNLDLVIMGFTPPVKAYTGKYPMMWRYWENLKTGEKVEGNYYSNGGYVAISEYYYLGLIGGFELGAYYEDKLISVGKVANLTDELRESATAEPDKYLGSVVEVAAMSIDSERNSLRHAKLVRLRPDKNAEECLYSEIF